METRTTYRVGSIGFLLAVLRPLTAKSAHIEGYALLEGQTNHEGIQIALGGSLTVPSISFWGAGLLLAAIGWFLLVRRRCPGACILAAAAVPALQMLLSAAFLQTAMTDATGFYRLTDVTPGYYRISAEKDCFVPSHIDPVHVVQANVTVDDMLLSDLNAHNEAAMPVYLKQISAAQTAYNNNSSPHTYTGDLACLVSGNDAGGVGFLDPDFADGIIGGYQIVMEVGDPISHPSGVIVFWYYEVSAVPLSYGCSGRISFYIDSSTLCPGCMIQAQDLGGIHGDDTLPYLCPGDASTIAHLNIQSLVHAQTDYHNNSSPHTYTGDLACLVSGNGAAQVRLICRELDDGLACGYNYDLTASEPVGGVSNAWECTAWPVIYGSGAVMTFFVDESGVVRGADIGGGPGDETLPNIGYADDTCP